MHPAKRLVLPHFRHGARAHAISSTALSLYSLFVGVSMLSFTFLARQSGIVLGYATDIYVNEIINLTNDARRSQGLSELKLNDSLSQAAQAKAEDMFEDDYWAHIAPDGTTPWVFIEQSGYHFYSAGENLARDFDSSSAVVQAWMDSPSHRDNLLGSYSEIGVAVVDGNLAGNETTLVVQMFGTTRGGVAATAPTEASVEVTPVAITSETAGLSVEEGSAEKNSTPESQIVPKFRTNLSEVTKNSVMLFAAFLFVLFGLDLLIVSRKGLIRVSGNNIAHLSLLVFLLFVVWWSNLGGIL